MVTFNDGAVHNITGASDQIDILDGPGNAPTTVNVQAGAVVGAGLTNFSVNVRNNSIFTMSGGSLNDELFLFNNASAQLSGGSIGDDLTPSDNATVTATSVTVNDDVEAHGNSITTISGGDFNEDIETLDSSTINISGGMFQTGTDGAYVTAAGTSTINISGGTFGVGEMDNIGAIRATENSVVNLHGGDVSGLPEGLQASGNGVINIYGLGGRPTSLQTSDSGIINVFDGPLQNLAANGSGVYNLRGSDGSLQTLTANGTTTVNIYGSSFLVNNVPVGFGPVGTVAGNLKGTLSDGSALNVSFTRVFNPAPGARINLVAIPEPATLTIAIGALAITVAYRRRETSAHDLTKDSHGGLYVNAQCGAAEVPSHGS